MTITATTSNNKKATAKVGVQTFPDWIEKLHYSQGDHAYDKKKFDASQACGVISVTTAIKILNNDQKLTPNNVIAKIRKKVSGGIMPGTDSPYWWALRANTPKLYGLKSGKAFTGNLTESAIKSMKSRLLKGQMLLAHSQKGYFLKKTGGETRYHASHTIMFYKYENDKFWAKDSYKAKASVGYTKKDLKNLFRNGTTNSVYWVKRG